MTVDGTDRAPADRDLLLVLAHELGIPPAEVSLGSALSSDLGLDGWDLLELVAELEDLFCVSLDAATLQGLHSVADLVESLERLAPSRDAA